MLNYFPGLKSYWERSRDDSLMLATICGATWNVLNMQHIIPNSKRWDYSDIPGGGQKKIEGPTHMAEGAHHLRKAPNPHPPFEFEILHVNHELINHLWNGSRVHYGWRTEYSVVPLYSGQFPPKFSQ